MQIKFRYIWINNFSQLVTVKPHSHNCCEIIFYKEADGYSNIYGEFPNLKSPKETDITYSSLKNPNASRRLIFKDSTVVFFKSDQVHDEIHTKPAKLVALGFEINNVLPFDLDSIVVKDDNGNIETLINCIVKEHDNESVLYKNAIENYISLIIIEILRLNNQTIERHNPIFNAISYLSNYFFTEIDFDNLAKIVGYSTGHFRYLFKKKLGISPKKFVLNKRYEHAMKLLKDNLPLEKVASLCGYDDYPQFSTFFKSMSGISPTQYRAKIK